MLSIVTWLGSGSKAEDHTAFRENFGSNSSLQDDKGGTDGEGEEEE